MLMDMPEIDLDPHEYSRQSYGRPCAIVRPKKWVYLPGGFLDSIALKVLTYLCGFWFAAVVLMSNYSIHPFPWWAVAAVAFAPIVVLGTICVLMDDVYDQNSP